MRACRPRCAATTGGPPTWSQGGWRAAAAEKLPLVVFVFNDRRLGMVEIGHKAVYGLQPSYPMAELKAASRPLRLVN